MLAFRYSKSTTIFIEIPSKMVRIGYKTTLSQTDIARLKSYQEKS